MNKKCNKCKLEKSLSEFHKNKWQTDGYSHYCKSCKAIKAKEYRETNPEIEKTRKARWYKDNKEYADIKNNLWAKKNPKKRREIANKYYYLNKPLYFAHAAKRRALKLQAIPGWFSKESVEAIYTKARDLSKNSEVRYVVDHIVPLVSNIVCGLHTIENLQILPEKENISKGNRYWPDMPIDIP